MSYASITAFPDGFQLWSSASKQPLYACSRSTASARPGFWTVAIGESNHDLIYILQWESLDDRDKRFASFLADPEWIEARRKSEEDGPLVASISNTIMTPTAFSAMR